MAYIKLEDLQKFPIRIDHYDKENGNEHFVLGIESVIEYAENLPTADVEEIRHGEWLEQRLLGKTVYDCSECATLGSPMWKRCPVCEAKMDGKRKEK